MPIVIDIGSNSVRLMQACVGPEGLIAQGGKRLVTTRLGAQVGRTGRLDPEAMERSIGAISAFLADHPDPDVRIFATSAVRDAANRQAFLDALRAATGRSCRVLTGRQEALAGFLGAAGRQHAGLIDIGGNSTEVMWGREGRLCQAVSFQLGAVRGSGWVDLSGKSTPEQVGRATERIDAVLGDFRLTDRPARYLGIGGTITTLAAMELGLTAYDPARVAACALSHACVARWTARLLDMPLAARKTLPGLQSARADVIGWGALILQRLMDRLDIPEIHPSDRDNMEGIYWMDAEQNNP